MRLGVYSDLRFWRDDEGRLATNRAFIRFVTGMTAETDEIVIFGRLSPDAGVAPYPVEEQGVRFVALPWYPRVSAIRAMISCLRRSAGIFSAQLDHVDAVWLFGPHPVTVLFALIARRRGIPIFLGVRQDYPTYIANRLPSRWWAWGIVAAHVLEGTFRRLARRAPTVAVGQELARHYAGGSAPVLATGFSLVSRHDIVDLDTALARCWDQHELTLLSVGRLDPEKNPHLLLDVVTQLRLRDPRWRLLIAGDGPMRPEIEARVQALGLSGAVTLLGEVANGPRLWELYRTSHLFLHISFTEGLPQVMHEAHAAGIPVIGTAVGGVPAALGDGRSGLLIPPADLDAAVAAVHRLAGDSQLRRRLVTEGLRSARQDETLEAQVERTAAFFRSALGAGGAPASAGPGPESERAVHAGAEA